MTSECGHWTELFTAVVDDTAWLPDCTARLARAWAADAARLLPTDVVREASGAAVRISEDRRVLRAGLGPRGVVVVLELTRSTGSPAFDDAEIQALQCAMPALTHAATQAHRLAASQLAGLLEGLAVVGRAALVLDGGGSLVAQNRLLRHGLGIEVRGGAFRPPAESRAGKAVATALASGRRSGCVLGTSSRKGDTLLLAEALPSAAASPFQTGRVLVSVIEPSAPADAEWQLYGALYDLTPREAEIAAWVARGWSIGAISVAAGISQGHCRQRLQAVFRKTGTSRQGELAALLGRIR